MSVLVVLQSANGELSRVSTEALTAALQIAESQDVPLEAAVLGTDVLHLASQVTALSYREYTYLITRSLASTRPKDTRWPWSS